ncbi:MAG: hypothetical protein ACE5D4_08885 [Thermodesulfobacteriota bacterium]
MFKEKILACSWMQFEEMARERIGSDFAWRVQPQDTEVNRLAVMESILSAMIENNCTFPERGNIYIEPQR